MGSSWGQEEEGGASEAPVEVQVDSSQLPLVEGEDGEQVFRFYWLDAFEDPYSQPGKAYSHLKWIYIGYYHVNLKILVSFEEQILIF